MSSKILFNHRLKEIRIDRGLSRPQVSESTGISVDTIKSWELGINTPTIENLKILADFYEVSLDYIAGRTANPEINN